MKWEEPPIIDRKNGCSLEPVREELKANPGKWALVQEQMKSSSSAKPWQKYGFEAVCRKDPDTGLHNIYARWPEPEPETEKVEVRSMLGPAIVERPKVQPPPPYLNHSPLPGSSQVELPERHEGETDQAYRWRCDRFKRGVPTEGYPMQGEKPERK